MTDAPLFFCPDGLTREQSALCYCFLPAIFVLLLSLRQHQMIQSDPPLRSRQPAIA